MVAGLRRAFHEQAPQALSWRRGQLRALGKMLREGRESLQAAMWRDLHRSKLETDVLEIGRPATSHPPSRLAEPVLLEIHEALDKLSSVRLSPT